MQRDLFLFQLPIQDDLFSIYKLFGQKKFFQLKTQNELFHFFALSHKNQQQKQDKIPYLAYKWIFIHLLLPC